MFWFWRITLSLCLVALGGAHTFAQEDAARSASARTLFEEGVQFYDHGQWSDAADRFRRALLLRDSQVIRFNLAAALLELNKVVEASELLRQVERSEGLDPTLHTQAQERLATAMQRMARLTINVEGEVQGALVELDGRPISDPMLGVGIPVDPGPHTVRLLRQQRELDAQPIDLAAGQSGALTLRARQLPTVQQTAAAAVAQPAAASAPIESARSEHKDNSRKTKILWWSVGAGGAVVVAAVLIGVLASQSSNRCCA
jgi:hypothetical protein